MLIMYAYAYACSVYVYMKYFDEKREGEINNKLKFVWLL